MDASKAAESRQLRARAKKKSRYLHLSARVDFPFKACESHQQHFSALASFANVLAFCTCVLPTPTSVSKSLSLTSYHDLAQGRIFPTYGA